MKINRIGHAIVRAPSCNLHLKNILHVPQANKNLVSIYRLLLIIKLSLNFILIFSSLIKDKDTKKVLLEGKCKGGLYPLPADGGEALSAIKPSSARWHSRLGHPAHPCSSEVISKLSVKINFLAPVKQVVSRFVMLVNKQRVIFRIRSLLVCPVLL